MITNSMLNDLKQYIKCDGEDNNLAASLYEAAIELAETETGKKFKVSEDGTPSNPLYWLAIKMMVAHWYDNRGNGSEKNFIELPMSSRELLNHIALCNDFERKEESK